MSEGKYIMAFDFGTSGTKAILVDFDMNFIASGVAGYPLLTPQIGYAEQNPSDYWRAVCTASQNVMETAGVPIESIKAISFGTQGMGIIPVDEQGNVLHNNITWVDSRASEQAEKINRILGMEAQNSNDVVSKLLWLKEKEPKIYEKARYFLDCTGYLIFKSTGSFAVELTSAGPYSLDLEMQAYKDRLYAAAGIDKSKLPPLKICTEYIGNLTSQAAKQLGLTTQAAVYMGIGDVAAAAAGCGCCKTGDAHVYIGSSAWLTVIQGETRLQTPSPGIYQTYSIDKDLLIYGGCVQSACMTFNWAIEQFYRMESKQEDVYGYIDREIRQVPPGSKNLIATPWLYGEHCPVLDEKARAVFFNVTNLHDRRYFINAIMEGICYSLRGQMALYTHDTGKTLTRISAVGGGALSEHWMQMLADVIKLPVDCPQNVRHAGAMGAAFAAGVGLGLYEVHQMKTLISTEKTFYPRGEYAKTYDKLYGVFSKIHHGLKDLFAELNS